MKVEKTKVDHERNLLIALIVSTEFVKSVQPILDTKLLQTPASRTVTRWCLDYYDKYEEAPGLEIRAVFDGQRDGMPEEDQEYIERMLRSLSSQYERFENFNHMFYADQAEEYLKKRKLERLVNMIGQDLESGDVDKAEHRIATFERVQRPRGEAIDMVEDETKLREALLNMKEDSLIQLSGDLGKLLGAFHRGDLVSIAAPMKRGKSWWLMYLGMAAFLNDLNVLFVSLEMLENQVLSRFSMMMTGRPTKMETVRIPRFLDNGMIEYVEELREPLAYDEDFENTRNMVLKTARGHSYRLLTFPQDTLSVGNLETHLDNMEHFEDYIPDVIVVDYADIMAPESYRSEYRHRLDETWKKLRGLAQKRHCLVVTATQTGRQTLKKDAHGADVAEDIRKLAHVAKMIGLNQREFEKDRGFMRVNVMVDRHEGAVASKEVAVLQSLEIGKPVLDSRWTSKLHSEVLYDNLKR